MKNSDKSLDDIYLKTARELGISSHLVKDIVLDIFSFSRDFITNPTDAALLLNNFVTIEARHTPIKHLINKKEEWAFPEEKENWKILLEKVIEYQKTKKIVNKNLNKKEEERNEK